MIEGATVVAQDGAVSLRVPSFEVKSDDTLRRCYLPNKLLGDQNRSGE